MLDSVAFVFPGQGSQAVGMGVDLCAEFASARRAVSGSRRRPRLCAVAHHPRGPGRNPDAHRQHRNPRFSSSASPPTAPSISNRRPSQATVSVSTRRWSPPARARVPRRRAARAQARSLHAGSRAERRGRDAGADRQRRGRHPRRHRRRRRRRRHRERQRPGQIVIAGERDAARRVAAAVGARQAIELPVSAPSIAD